uniref:Elongation of very long chain fatty acids protein n=1 Tax=Parastrongyloides trichosuri TaxID=131310 RepID=A0A0N4ZQK3_PARTI
MDGTVFFSMISLLFEPKFNSEIAGAYVKQWLHFFPYLGLFYIIMVFGGQKVMKSRKAFDLSNFVFVWNLGFSIYSGISTYKIFPDILKVLNSHGIEGTYCHVDDYYSSQVMGYWAYIFLISKTFEFGDTLLLVLRKKPVIFMHWYHHLLTNYITVLSYTRYVAWPRLSIFMNVVVHTIMYFYFATSAKGIKYPNIVRKFITSIQLIQFAISLGFFSHITIKIISGDDANCEISYDSHFLGLAMYLSYLYLFGRFFYKSYIAKVKKN